MKIETVEEWLAKGNVIIYPKPNRKSNYCHFCRTWGSIKKYHHMEYHYYMGEVVAKPILKYKRCMCCHKWVDENKEEI